MPANPTTVRLRTPNDLVGAVPYLLGFHPTDSLVMVSLRGPKNRVGLTLRIDLPGAAYEPEMARQLIARAQHAEADSVLFLCYRDLTRTEQGQLPRYTLAEALRAEAERVDLAVEDVMLVSGGRRYSYLCRDPRCCPPEGNLISTPTSPAIGTLAARTAYDGKVVLPDREALVAALAPVDGPWRPALEQAYVREDVAMAERMMAGQLAEIRQETLALAGQLCGSDPRAPGLTQDQTARLVLGLDDIVVRDEVLGWAVEREDDMLTMLRRLCPQALPPWDAAVCAMLAWVGYIAGDGAVAVTGVERALRTDPDYSMARLLDDVISRQLAPTYLRQALRESAVSPGKPTPRRSRTSAPGRRRSPRAGSRR